VHQSSGFFNATVASSGSFSAKILLAGKSLSLSANSPRAALLRITLCAKVQPGFGQLQLDLGGGGITASLATVPSSPIECWSRCKRHIRGR